MALQGKLQAHSIITILADGLFPGLQQCMCSNTSESVFEGGRLSSLHTTCRKLVTQTLVIPCHVYTGMPICCRDNCTRRVFTWIYPEKPSCYVRSFSPAKPALPLGICEATRSLISSVIPARSGMLGPIAHTGSKLRMLR